MIVDRQFVVVQSMFIELSRADAERFYAERQGKFLYTGMKTGHEDLEATIRSLRTLLGQSTEHEKN